MKLINFMKLTIKKSSLKKLILLLKISVKKIGFKSVEEFQDYLKIKSININDLKKVNDRAFMWNQLIFDKYRNLVKIDKEN